MMELVKYNLNGTLLVNIQAKFGKLPIRWHRQRHLRDCKRLMIGQPPRQPPQLQLEDGLPEFLPRGPRVQRGRRR